MLSLHTSRLQPHLRNLHVHQLDSSSQDLTEEILLGLTAPQKQLPPKLFYDERGSQLFEAITRLPEYYPTRTEREIFHQHKRQLQELVEGRILIEPGSGSCDKARLLIQSERLTAYVPIEISTDYFIETALTLAQDYPALQIHALCGDFTRISSLPENLPDGPRTVFFPGSTLGNFEPEQAIALLRQFRDWTGPGGGLLVGVDTRKEESLLNAAYNDSQGITAAFNLNILSQVNRLTGADFQPDRFVHKAFYNPGLGRIEMHLQSLCHQRVHLAGRSILLRAGETIHTENSYKYEPAQFAELAASAGFQPRHCWQDRRGYFSLHYCVARP